MSVLIGHDQRSRDTGYDEPGYDEPGYDGSDDVAPARALRRLAGRRLVVLNWRDVLHPQAGGAERFIHEISRRWVRAGAEVTMLTARGADRAACETIDGVEIRRAGGELSVYPRTALRLCSEKGPIDAVVDCQNGIPFFAPLSLGPRVPVVQVVHHVHQNQFDTRFGTVMSAIGRTLEGPVARRVYARHRCAAVSSSTRQEMRARLRVNGAIDIVPNGAPAPRVPGERSPRPSITVVGRLVPHKRFDLLVDTVAVLAGTVPGLRVDVIGAGPELARLRMAVARCAVGRTITIHGRVDDAARDALLARAWLTTSTSDGEGWGLSVLEAAAAGVPCVAIRAPGVRDSVIDGRTGWLVESPHAFAGAVRRALDELASPARAAAVADACRFWASCFTWDRSAELLAATVLTEIEQITDPRPERRGDARRLDRTDMCTAIWCTHPEPPVLAQQLRLTDEVTWSGTDVRAVLRGCDDVTALSLLERFGAGDVRVRPAGRHEILGGPRLLARTASTGPGR